MQVQAQLQSTVSESSQKEKQLLTNHLLGKVFSTVEIILSRYGLLSERNFHKYSPQEINNHSNLDLLRNIKAFITAMWSNTCDSPLILQKALNKEAKTHLNILMSKASLIDVDSLEAETTKKILLTVLFDLSNGKAQRLDSVLSNELYSTEIRNHNAKNMGNDKRAEIPYVATAVQEGMRKLTNQLQQLSREDEEFSEEPRINFDARSIKVLGSPANPSSYN